MIWKFFHPALRSIESLDPILEADKQVHAMQRHTAVRILERLCEEHGFTGGYAIVRNYVDP